ncbi:MAG: histidine kinase [Bacteroidetes bacterium]|nr:histidine kinase [Bacteroidota bacterium]
MKFFNQLKFKRTLLFSSIIIVILVIYPNITNLFYNWNEIDSTFIKFFIFRFSAFTVFTYILLFENISKLKSNNFSKRLFYSFIITLVFYGINIIASLPFYIYEKPHIALSILLFQCLFIYGICLLIGHIYSLHLEQDIKEKKIKQLKIENLQSKCDALANQISPHFFFNSLNGLTGLVENEQALEYINKLSGIFRYILQKQGKDIVTLKEELDFLQSYRYLIEVRYSGKLFFDIKIDNNFLGYKIPFLSFLPLIENIIKHNKIDSDNKMFISVYVNKNNELIISNPIREKMFKEPSNGIGLTNLSSRFHLLIHKDIKIDNNNDRFSVYLPLTA